MLEIISDNVYKSAYKKGLRPETKLSVSEWADRFRELSEVSSAEPGRWRTARTPYLKEIMDVLSHDDPTQEIVFMKSAQIGGTECGLNWIAYIIDHNPGPTMLVNPTVELAKRNSKQRIAPLIEASESLKKKVKSSKSRDSGNTILQKDFPSGTLIMTGSNSAVGLRSVPAKYLFLDEVDGYESDVDGEGDPITLASARQRTFAKRKKFLVSTPTIAGLSKIEPAYEKSDQRKYYVPCPHCEHFQHLEFPKLIFDRESDIITRASYACVECGVLIDEHFKNEMLEKGKWVKHNPESPVAGFHINSLYSPLGWYSWVDIANDFIETKKDPTKLKGFVNTVLGETWKDRGEAPDWERLYERRTPRPRNIVPEDALLLTAGVDVQKDRLELEIVAWGRYLRSWSIDYRVIPGNTDDDEVWDKLSELLYEQFPYENERKQPLQIRAMGIDSGYNTQRVYHYVRNSNQSRVYATKGRDTLTQILGQPSKVDINFRGKKVSRGVQLWHVGVNVLKSELYGFLRLAKPKDDESRPVIGYCDFPEYEEEFFKMLTGEQVVIQKVRGYSKRVWEKTRERNEALDCRVIARAMANLVGIDRFKERNWEKLEKSSPHVHTKDSNLNKTPRKKIKRRQGSNWL